MRVLVCGSRKWPSPALAAVAREVLRGKLDELPFDAIVIEGDAHEGVDRWAGELATRRCMFVAQVPVGPKHYERWGRSAPIKRDMAMLDLLQPGTDDHVIALQFAGSPGTQFVTDEAGRRGLRVDLTAWDGPT